MSRTLLFLFVPALLAGCYRPSGSDNTGDATPDTEEETTEDTAVDLPEETAEDTPADPVEETEDTAGDTAEDTAVEDTTEESELPALPVDYAPDFTLQDLNSNSPTFGDMRSIWGERGKVIVLYFGNFN